MCILFILFKVENRDREIERLHRVLDGGRAADVISLESKLKSNEKLVAHQNVQVRKQEIVSYNILFF